MRKITLQVLREITRRDDDWVQAAQTLVKSLKGQDKERQLRNIQSIAEGSASWKALALFIRYQAARGELPRQWAEDTIRQLGELANVAEDIARRHGANSKVVHMEIVSRVLGYAVRWHVWDVKGKGVKQ
ncbi:MAG TPA: hypothetical protein ENK07_10875 [Bacteroidetes bacterium]|nr:hypothetical protein [Bacteroidota bacterium]